MKEQIYERISKDAELQGKIMASTGKSFSTLRRWIKNKDARLNSPEVLLIIKEHLKIKDYSELLILL